MRVTLAELRRSFRDAKAEHKDREEGLQADIQRLHNELEALDEDWKKRFAEVIRARDKASERERALRDELEALHARAVAWEVRFDELLRLFARLRVQPTTTRRVVAQKGALTRRGHKK